MKQNILFIVFLSLVQLTFAQKEGYYSTFTTESQIKNYLAKNITSIDPIEGIFDVQCTQRNGSPFAPNSTDSWTYYIVKSPYSETFTIYFDISGSITKSDNVIIESIGETNAYRVHYRNSSTRAYLENNLRLSATIQLSQSDARYYTSNPKCAYWITIGYDLVKRYPTASMYKEAIRKEVEEVVAQQPKEWSGTGFALNNGYIVTNHHVIEDAKSIAVQGIKGATTEYKAKVVGTDKNNDLAILKIDDSRFTGFGTLPYKVNSRIADVGEEVFVLGYPLTQYMGEEIKLTNGIISSRTGYQGDISSYQMSAPVQPGNSGGALFDSKGDVIGIVNAGIRAAENVGYAVKTPYLNTLVATTVNDGIIPKTAVSMANLSLAEKVKKIRNFVFFIKCSSEENANASYASIGSYSGSANSSSKIYNKPYVSRNNTKDLIVESVTLESSYTKVVISSDGRGDGGYYEWCSIDKNAYIIVNGTKYTMTIAEGIAIAPQHTTYSPRGKRMSFALYFPAISKSTTSFDFIESESSEWKLYGIQLK